VCYLGENGETAEKRTGIHRVPTQTLIQIFFLK
jgi:hypothetical protein